MWEYRCVLRFLLNDINDWDSLMLTGRLFQTCGGVHEKQRVSPDMKVLLVSWTNSLELSEAEQSPSRAGQQRDKRELKYSGVVPLRRLNTKTMILRVILSSMGSQYSSSKYRDAWSRFVALQMSLAVQFRIFFAIFECPIDLNQEGDRFHSLVSTRSMHEHKMTCAEVQKPHVSKSRNLLIQEISRSWKVRLLQRVLTCIDMDICESNTTPRFLTLPSFPSTSSETGGIKVLRFLETMTMNSVFPSFRFSMFLFIQILISLMHWQIWSSAATVERRSLGLKLMYSRMSSAYIWNDIPYCLVISPKGIVQTENMDGPTLEPFDNPNSISLGSESAHQYTFLLFSETDMIETISKRYL